MIKLENTQVVGWEPTIRGMRNPMNSWAKSDTMFFAEGDYWDICGNSGPANRPVNPNEPYEDIDMELGSADKDLMMRLASAGSVDAKYRRMIVVYVDITAPFYWWKEFDTYKVGTVANSCSTMHKIAAKPFELDDFSHEHLAKRSMRRLLDTIEELNFWRDIYLNGGEVDNEDGTATVYEPKSKEAWWQMIQLLPSTYNQRRTIMLNYEVLAGLYPKRKNHKLDEWHVFCDWIKSLPYSEIITLEEPKKDPKYNIVFEEYRIDPVSNSTTLYFIAPKEMLGDKYPEAESMEISIEFPTHLPEARYASVMRSPTKDGSDYDWSDYDIGLDEIERLIKLAEVTTAVRKTEEGIK